MSKNIDWNKTFGRKSDKEKEDFKIDWEATFGRRQPTTNFVPKLPDPPKKSILDTLNVAAQNFSSKIGQATNTLLPPVPESQRQMLASSPYPDLSQDIAPGSSGNLGYQAPTVRAEGPSESPSYAQRVQQRKQEVDDIRQRDARMTTAPRTEIENKVFDEIGVKGFAIVDPITGRTNIEFSVTDPNKATKEIQAVIPGTYDRKTGIWTVRGVSDDFAKTIAKEIYNNADALKAQWNQKGLGQQAIDFATRIGDSMANAVTGYNLYKNVSPAKMVSTDSKVLDQVADTIGFLLGMSSGQGLMGEIGRTAQGAGQMAEFIAPKLPTAINLGRATNLPALANQVASKAGIPTQLVQSALQSATRLGLIRGMSSYASGADDWEAAKAMAKGAAAGAIAGPTSILSGQFMDRFMERYVGDVDISMLAQFMRSGHEKGTYFSIISGMDAALEGKGAKDVIVSSLTGYATGVAFAAAEAAGKHVNFVITDKKNDLRPGESFLRSRGYKPINEWLNLREDNPLKDMHKEFVKAFAQNEWVKNPAYKDLSMEQMESLVNHATTKGVGLYLKPTEAGWKSVYMGTSMPQQVQSAPMIGTAPQVTDAIMDDFAYKSYQAWGKFALDIELAMNNADVTSKPMFDQATGQWYVPPKPKKQQEASYGPEAKKWEDGAVVLWGQPQAPVSPATQAGKPMPMPTPTSTSQTPLTPVPEVVSSPGEPITPEGKVDPSAKLEAAPAPRPKSPAPVDAARVIERLEAEINRVVSKPDEAATGPRYRQSTPEEVAKPEIELAQAYSTAFGRSIIMVTPTSAERDVINGWYDPETGTVVVSIHANNPAYTTAVHEVVHGLTDEERATLWDAVKGALKEDKFQEWLMNKYSIASSFTNETYEPGGIVDEFIADFSGEAFSQVAFVEAFIRENPELADMLPKDLLEIIRQTGGNIDPRFRAMQTLTEEKAEGILKLFRDAFARQARATRAATKPDLVPKIEQVKPAARKDAPRPPTVTPVKKGPVIGASFSVKEQVFKLSREVAFGIIKATEEQGGISASLIDGHVPTKGYMVAMGAKYGAIVKSKDFFDLSKGVVILGDYAVKHYDNLIGKGFYLGVWHDEANNDVYLDVSQNILDRNVAVQAGKDRDQKAIWDVVNFAEIETGGTGHVEEGQDGRSEVEKRDDGERDTSVGGRRSQDADGELREGQKLQRESDQLVPQLKPKEGIKDFSFKAKGELAKGAFYSQLENIIKQKMGGRMSAEELRKMVKAGGSGVKKEELAWTGFDVWLEEQGTRSVSKDEVLKYLKDNATVLEVKEGESHSGIGGFESYMSADVEDYKEVVFSIPTESMPGAGPYYEQRMQSVQEFDRLLAQQAPRLEQLWQTELTPLIEGLIDVPYVIADFVRRTEEALTTLNIKVGSLEWVSGMLRGFDTPYDQTPSILEDNFAERVIEYRNGMEEFKQSGFAPDNIDAHITALNKMITFVSIIQGLHTTSEQMGLGSFRPQKNPLKDVFDRSYGHWRDTNVVAHVRYGDVVDADGKKYRYLQEFQSDMHQKARDMRQAADITLQKYIAEGTVIKDPDTGMLSLSNNNSPWEDVLSRYGADFYTDNPTFTGYVPQSFMAKYAKFLALGEELEAVHNKQTALYLDKGSGRVNRENLPETATLANEQHEISFQMGKLETEMQPYLTMYGLEGNFSSSHYKEIKLPIEVPFKNFHELAIKWSIHNAVTEGYDGVIFAGGADNANLYSTLEQVDEIRFYPDMASKVGAGTVRGFLGGNEVIERDVSDTPELMGLVGSSIAKQLLETGPVKTRSDTRIMPRFAHYGYDELNPDQMNHPVPAEMMDSALIPPSQDAGGRGLHTIKAFLKFGDNVYTWIKGGHSKKGYPMVAYGDNDEYNDVSEFVRKVGIDTYNKASKAYPEYVKGLLTLHRPILEELNAHLKEQIDKYTKRDTTVAEYGSAMGARLLATNRGHIGATSSIDDIIDMLNDDVYPERALIIYNNIFTDFGFKEMPMPGNENLTISISEWVSKQTNKYKFIDAHADLLVKAGLDPATAKGVAEMDARGNMYFNADTLKNTRFLNETALQSLLTSLDMQKVMGENPDKFVGPVGTGAYLVVEYHSGEPLQNADGKYDYGSTPEEALTAAASSMTAIYGDDLLMGNVGLAAFYDKKVLPWAAKFVKQFGAKWEGIEFENAKVYGGDVGQGFMVTDKMRESAKKGMPLFSIKGGSQQPSRAELAERAIQARIDKTRKLLPNMSKSAAKLAEQTLKRYEKLLAEVKAKGVTDNNRKEITRLMQLELDLPGMKQGYQDKVQQSRKDAAKKLQDYKDQQKLMKEKRKLMQLQKSMQREALKLLRKLEQQKDEMPPHLRKVAEQLLTTFNIDLFAMARQKRTDLKLQAMIDYISAQQGVPSDVSELILPQGVLATLNRVNQTRIVDLTPRDVAALGAAASYLIHQSLNEKKIIATDRAEDLDLIIGETVRTIESRTNNLDQSRIPEYGLLKLGGKYLFNEGAIHPVGLAEDLSDLEPDHPIVRIIYDDSVEAMRDKYGVVVDLHGEVETITKGVDGHKNWAEQEVKIVPRQGTAGEWKKPIVMNKKQVISFWLSLFDQDYIDHLLSGGFRPEGFREVYKLEPSDIRWLRANLMDADMKAYAEAWITLRDNSAPHLNRISMLLNNFEIATLPDYFPIQMDRREQDRDFSRHLQRANVEGRSYFRERTGGKGTVLIRDIDDVMRDYLTATGNYMYAPYMRNAKLVMGNAYLRKALEARYGKPKGWSQTLMEKVMQDMWDNMSGQRVDHNPVEMLFGKALVNFQQAVLSINMALAFKQIASYPTFMSYIDPKYLAQALLIKTDWDIIRKYSPILGRRPKGYSDREIAEVADRAAQGKHPTAWATKAVPFMDSKTIGLGWNAMSLQIKDQQPHLTGDDYWREVARQAETAVFESQPNYTPGQRPAVLRIKNPMGRAFFMWSTQKNQHYSLMVRGARRLDKARRLNEQAKGQTGSQKKATEDQAKQMRDEGARFIAAALTGNLFFAFLSLLEHRIWRKRTKDDITIDMFKRTSEALIGSFFLAGELYNGIVNKYDQTPGGSVGKVLSDVISSVAALTGTRGTTAGKIRRLAEDLSQLTGYPVKNIIRDVTQGIEHIAPDIAYELDKIFTNYTNTQFYDMYWAELERYASGLDAIEKSKLLPKLEQDMRDAGVTKGTLKSSAQRKGKEHLLPYVVSKFPNTSRKK